MVNKEIALIRIGEIGDTITAVEFCKYYGFDLLVSETKSKLLFNKKLSSKFIDNMNAISKHMNFKIRTISSISDLRKYKKILFFVQKSNSISRVFTKLIGYLINKNINFVCEGSNYFHISYLKQNKWVKTKIRKLIKEKNKKIKVAICWKGKEKEKNIPIINLEKLLNFTSKSGFETTLLGDEKIKLKNKDFKNLSGLTTLSEAMKIIDKTDILISVDTGLLHYSVSKKKVNIALVAHRYELAIWYPFYSDTYLIYDFFSKISLRSKLNKDMINNEIKSIFN